MAQALSQKSEFTVEGARRYNTAGPVRWILSHGARYPFYLTSMLIFKLLSIATYSLYPIYIGQAADAIFGRASGNAAQILLAAGIGVLVTQLASGGSGLIGSLSSEYVAQRLEADAREELYRSLLGKSQTFHDRQRVGDIISRATEDVRYVNMMINPGASLIYETVTQLIVPFVLLAVISPALLLVPAIYMVGYVFTLRSYSDRLNPVAGAQRAAFGMMSAGLEESISGIETVKSSAQEPFERSKFEKNARGFLDQFLRQGRVEAGYLPPLVFGITYGLVILHAMMLFRSGAITVGEVVAVVGLWSLLWFPTYASIWTFSIVQLGLASARRILDIINAATDLDENTGGHSIPIRGEIVFDDVSFGYEGTEFGVKNISFSIQPGQTIAIVGQTGSGKTTLTHLVNRTYDVSKGRILVDGIDVREWDLDALRSQISKIEQDVFLFSRTIAENIAFGRPDATQSQIEQAAKEAQSHEFIMSFENGYQTVIGERGVTLSGGQRQRIALARAFLSDPRILILDDSTSAIDSATEDEIQKAIHRARQGRTTMLITHRLSQIRWADVIVVMEKGGIAAMGTHDDLLRRSELYRRIFARYDVALPPLEAAAD